MSRFHFLEVIDVKQETADAVSVALRVPPELRKEFTFLAGQYLTVKLSVNGEELRRSYSICSSPFEEASIRIAVKRVALGRASNRLVAGMKVGDKLEVMPPMGHFHTPFDASIERHFVAFAAGSGITPILSILSSVLRAEPKSRFTLFYGNTDTDRIIFRERLDELVREHGSRLTVHHVLSQGRNSDPLFNGRITADKAAQLLQRFVNDDLRKEFFICGPEQMMVSVSEALEKQRIDKKQIHIELFTSPVTTEAKKEVSHATSTAFNGQAEVEIVLDGRRHTLHMGSKGDPVLEVAIDAGLDVPYACKGAVCCTCKARVLEGQVEMEMNYALTDEEVADGYVLTCQTHPRSARVVIDYDQH
ncbi:MAG: 2Fe-2S iron-sulfur cluster binding domain-containing protein [Flavobacteriales bacterium]|nr:2Fe-2S iron-sulfur cluster binding domain-containing protein [Flavobacteriales bacterium]